MGKDGQSSKSSKPSKSPKKKSASSKKPNTNTAGATSAVKSSKGTGGGGGSKAVNSKVASAKGGKSSKGSSGGGGSSYSQSKSAPSSKVSKGGKQRSPGGRKPAAPSAATKGHQKKSPKSVKSGKKSAAGTAAASSSSAYSSATSDDSTAEVKSKAKNKAQQSTSEQQQEEGGGAEYGTGEDKASSTSYEPAEEEGSAEVESHVGKSKHKEKPPPPQPPAEKPLEFTKPTINQMKKEKKEKPLSMAERITSREFEQLFDEINELNSGVQMLKHSYASIIKSLVAIQTRRGKKKSAKEVQKKVADASGGKVTFLTTLSTCNPNELRTKSCLENTDKYDIENFLNPGTRDETFQLLFDEIEDLTKRFEPMRPFYDDRGRFRRDVYDAQEDVKMDRAMYNEFKIWCKKLSDIVDDIARNYNDDLLNMFRLN